MKLKMAFYQTYIAAITFLDSVKVKCHDGTWIDTRELDSPFSSIIQQYHQVNDAWKESTSVIRDNPEYQGYTPNWIKFEPLHYNCSNNEAILAC
jgi:hypothetical protein